MRLLKDFIRTKAASLPRFLIEQSLFLLLQNIPSALGIALRSLIYRAIIHNNGLFGIEENVQISYANNLKLGRNVYIGKNCYLSASGGGIELGDNVIIYPNCYIDAFNYFQQKNPDSRIIIENNVSMGNGCVIHGHSGIIIGENTIIGPCSSFITATHGDLEKNGNYRFSEIVTGAAITIGKNVWIGTNVSILPQVTIGDHAVVGAGSVVTNDVPANTVFAGVPAKKIRDIS